MLMCFVYHITPLLYGDTTYTTHKHFVTHINLPQIILYLFYILT